MLLTAVVILLVDKVAGHGYLFEPKSRQRQANEVGADYCPHVRTSCAASTKVIFIIGNSVYLPHRWEQDLMKAPSVDTLAIARLPNQVLRLPSISS